MIPEFDVNGSFVTDKWEPNDIDCVLLIGPDYPLDADADAKLPSGLPFVTMEFADEDGFRQFTERFFVTDRNHAPKGMIEVMP